MEVREMSGAEVGKIGEVEKVRIEKVGKVREVGVWK